jgi:hypothetical protein
MAAHGRVAEIRMKYERMQNEATSVVATTQQQQGSTIHNRRNNNNSNNIVNVTPLPNAVQQQQPTRNNPSTTQLSPMILSRINQLSHVLNRNPNPNITNTAATTTTTAAAVVDTTAITTNTMITTTTASTDNNNTTNNNVEAVTTIQVVQPQPTLTDNSNNNYTSLTTVRTIPRNLYEWVEYFTPYNDDDILAARAILIENPKLECKICMESAINTVIAKCGHMMCRTCMYNHVTISSKLECPFCREIITTRVPIILKFI